jgi:cobalamin biosynthesis Mg chelatase CobN
VECLITQLLFEHSLRIRLKAESNDSSEAEESAPPTPEATTPDSASATGTQEASETDTVVHSQGSSETTIAPSSSKQDKAVKETKKEKPRTADNINIIGKINSLVTYDLKSITEAKDFLFLLIYIPLVATLCVVFLYSLLGWRYVTGNMRFCPF